MPLNSTLPTWSELSKGMPHTGPRYKAGLAERDSVPIKRIERTHANSMLFKQCITLCRTAVTVIADATEQVSKSAYFTEIAC